MRNLKQLLANKDVVTIIGAVLIVVVLYTAYTIKVKQATSPILIPCAKVTIPARTRITEDMISLVEVSQKGLKGDIITNVQKDLLSNKYTNVGTMIPKGSFFYRGVVINADELPDSFLINLGEGMIAYNYSVDVKSTYGNSMYPGNYVDVYFKSIENNKIMIGKFIENLKILSVKDSAGNPVFENGSESRSPSQIIFEVTEEIHKLLRRAEFIENVRLILVPTNTSYINPDDENIVVNITSDYIKSYIESHSIEVD